jgi:hypothetical protein
MSLYLTGQRPGRKGSVPKVASGGAVKLPPGVRSKSLRGVIPVLESQPKIDQRSQIGQKRTGRVHEGSAYGEKGIAWFSFTLGNPPITVS